METFLLPLSSYVCITQFDLLDINLMQLKWIIVPRFNNQEERIKALILTYRTTQNITDICHICLTTKHKDENRAVHKQHGRQVQPC